MSDRLWIQLSCLHNKKLCDEIMEVVREMDENYQQSLTENRVFISTMTWAHDSLTKIATLQSNVVMKYLLPQSCEEPETKVWLSKNKKWVFVYKHINRNMNTIVR